MKWWKGMLGLEQDGTQLSVKADTSVPIDIGRQDRDNFITNRITLIEHEDRITNPVGLSATWACTNLVAGTIGSLPAKVYKADGQGARAEAFGHPLYYVLHDSPNYDLSALDFWEYMAAAVELQGNAFARIRRRSNGTLMALDPIPPQSVQIRRLSSGGLEYRWVDNGRETRLPGDEVFHIRGPMASALGGLSTLAVCRSTFSGAISTERAAAGLFHKQVRPNGILSTDREVALTKEQKEELNLYIQQNFAGAMAQGRPMILDRGMTWQQIDISPEDAQMLESRKFNGEEVCRLFGVPPAMVGYGDKASNWGTGKEADVLGFVKFTLRRRLKRIEQAVMKQLVTPADRASGLMFEFNLDGLLRADSMGRAQVNEIRLRNKLITINEVRSQDNLPPVPWGDRPWGQMQDSQINPDGTMPETMTGVQA